MSTTEEKLFDALMECNGLRANIKELKYTIQRAIDNIRKFQPDAGTSRAINTNYEDGRADAYIIVLGWMEELEKK